MSKINLNDEQLDLVSGGDITYTWNGEIGTIGMNGKNILVLLNKDAFVQYYNSVHGKKSDAEILGDLMAQGIVKKP